MSVTVLGTVALDTIKTPLEKKCSILGGSAVHFAMSARLFTKVNLVACIGDDFPLTYTRFLHNKGVDISSVCTINGPTFHWTGEYKSDFNRAITIDTKIGVLADFVPQVSARVANSEIVFLANVDPQIQEYFLSKIKKPRVTALDSMNYWIDNKRKDLLKVLKKVDIYCANEHEAKDLTGELNLIKAAKHLLRFGPKIILIKKGEHGALLYSKNFMFILPAYPIEDIVDPTGAGDTFAGGFMGYLAQQGSLEISNLKKALLFATVAASFNVCGFGVESTEKLTLNEIKKRVAQFKTYISIKEK
jgi:sugar/nucleoside kinase (ribokinase family)